MEIWAIINQRGGAGKTTTAEAIGAGLQLRGYSPLWVDTDPQGSLTYSLKATGGKVTVFDLLTQRDTAENAIMYTDRGDVIPADDNLTGADGTVTGTGREYRLREALESLEGRYSHIIIDTPPTLGIITVNALTAASGVIIPTQADVYSLNGVLKLSDTVATVRHYCNPALKIKGIVLTRFQKRTVLSREIAESLTATARSIGTRLYETRIRETNAIKEAQATRQSIFKYAPRSNAARDYSDLIDEILRG